MGILRADRITGLGGANAITGSTFFGNSSSNSNGSFLRIETGTTDDFAFGTGDFTIEFWFNRVLSTHQQHFYDFRGTTNTNTVLLYMTSNVLYYFGNGAERITSGTVPSGEWVHFALVRSSASTKMYFNGTQTGSTYSDSLNLVGPDEGSGFIGSNGGTDGILPGGSYLSAHLSNFRVQKGKAEYTAAFTPPTHRLEKTPETVLLTCNSASDSSNEETGKVVIPTSKSINSKGPEASRFTPNSPVGFSTTTDVGSQYGTTFDGFGSFATSTYMVPPSGNTRERNRGRGLIGQGKNTTSPSNIKGISFIEIQSGGTAFDFGDSTNGSMYAMTAVSSSTRAVFAGGHTSQASPYPVTNLMEFVTISTTSNCTDFGDLNVGAANRVGASNQTRGLIAAGYAPNTRNIDKIEIATLGDATDYGDLVNQGFYGLNSGGMVSSSTRGVYAGGSGNSAPVAVNTITFSLFSTSGNSTDFGDLTHTNAYFNTGNSNGTRGIFMGGSDIDSPYPATDQIDYVTIASAGNAIDFGSLNTSRYSAMGASNSTRGVIAGGRINPAPSLPATNHMEYVTISTTGNGLDFGELIEPERTGAGCSDSHGGL